MKKVLFVLDGQTTRSRNLESVKTAYEKWSHTTAVTGPHNPASPTFDVEIFKPLGTFCEQAIKNGCTPLPANVTFS
jgi:hypothetical protein